MGKSNQEGQEASQNRKYQKIDKEQRKVVLSMLLHDKLSMQEVANRLGLKYCTIRTIQKAYELEGRIGKKETRKRKLKVENIVNISIIHPLTLQPSQPLKLSQVGSIYIDKQPGIHDNITLNQLQHQLLTNINQSINNSLLQQLHAPREQFNLHFITTIQNLLIGQQFLFKQINQSSQPYKQEFEAQTPQFVYPQLQPFIQ